MKIVAIIPARGGSKRIPGKNIVDFYGKPLIAWTIEAALKAKIFDDVIVSTDDENIAEIARHFGASVPFLRKNYADDFSTVSMATVGTLEQLRSEVGQEYELVFQLMPNCPLRREHHIVEAAQFFKRTGAISQISCFRFGWMNPWWAAKIDEHHCPESVFPNYCNKRSQDLPRLYCPTGAIWIARTEALCAHQTFHIQLKKFFEMPWDAAIDIDDLDDLRMAKVLYSMGV